jgi:hypothetical protein
MAGSLTISTLNNDTGVLASQNGMNGIAKAWVYFNGTTGATVSTFNVSSVTRNSTGLYTVNFSTALPNANYVPVVAAPMYNSANGAVFAEIYGSGTIGASGTKSTTQFQVAYVSYTSNFYDPAEYYVAIFSS